MSSVPKPWTEAAPATYELLRARLAAVRQWRQQESSAGRQTDLDLFFASQQLCFDCKSTGVDLNPVWWCGQTPLFVQCPRCDGTGELREHQFSHQQ